MVLELLHEFIALTENTLFRLVFEQLAISDNAGTFFRQLRSYRASGILDKLSNDTIKKVLRAGLPHPTQNNLHAYCLGSVGKEYAKRKGWFGEAPNAVITEEHLAHDLICAESMLRMRELWPKTSNPGTAEVRGPRAVAVWDTSRKVSIVEPDGLVIKYNPDGQFARAFVIEYQNVRSQLQVQNKIKRYEEIFKPDLNWVWRDSWGLPEMPWVLVLYRQNATVQHYQDELSKHDDLAAKYATTALDDIWAGKLSITPLRKFG